MKKIYSLLLISLLSGLFFLCSCHKKEDDSAQKETASDATQLQTESEEIVTEVNDALTGNSNTRNRTSSSSIFCNVTIDSTNAATGTLILTFNGQNCAGTKTRTGTITVQLNTPYNWNAINSVATVTISNFHITRLADNKSVTINGTKTITNISGGRIVDLAVGTGSVIHTVESSNMSAQFDDGSTCTWNVARKRTVTLESYGYVIVVEGTAYQNGRTDVAEWGINRRGNEFLFTIPEAVVWRVTNCPRGPISGERVLYATVFDLQINFGANQDGSYFSGGGCPYGYKIFWSGRKGRDYGRILSY
jgi:hypothetical protein